MTRGTTREAVGAAYAALQAGRFAAARDAVADHGSDPGARLLHALARAGAGEVGPAAAALDAIARANPLARHPVLDLVGLLQGLGEAAAAPAHLVAALALRPGDAGLLTALGAALGEHGAAADMVAAFQAATAARPDAAGWSNLGKALAATGDAAGAEAAFGQALALAPDDAQLRLNRGIALLRDGRMPEGWPLFRARHELAGRRGPGGVELTSLTGVAGRRVLLVHDEGFGDTLQFLRYAAALAALGARVQVSVPAPLRRLLAGNGFDVVDLGVKADTWCRFADLPALFGTTADTIPGTLPYLVADPALVSHWRARLPDGRRAGLVWAGAARRDDPAAMATDRVRSLPPRGLAALLAPLLGLADVRWVGLQPGAAPPPGVFDPMPGVRDFADTAAIIASLDLVVSVDTAVAHLAAAMGRRVLLLDRYDNCWRWFSGRTDSPWYPGVLQIVRQSSPGDWPGVVARAAALV